MLSGYRTYIIAAMLAAIALVEGVMGIDIPGAQLSGDWVATVLAALGLSTLRASNNK